MNELIKKLLETPDKAQEIALDLNDYISTLQTTLQEREETIAGANERVKELQETNQRLFMRVTSDVPEQREEEAEEPSAWEKAVAEAGYDPAELLDKKGI